MFDSADLDSAVEGVVDAIWFNQGQVKRKFDIIIDLHKEIAIQRALYWGNAKMCIMHMGLFKKELKWNECVCYCIGKKLHFQFGSFKLWNVRNKLLNFVKF